MQYRLPQNVFSTAVASCAALVANRRHCPAVQLQSRCRSFEELYDRYADCLKNAAAPPKSCPHAASAFSVLEMSAACTQGPMLRTHGSWRSADAAGDGSVYIVGTNHISEASVMRVQQMIRELQPTCLILEVCEERLLPFLCCPREHLNAWNTASLPLQSRTHASLYLPKQLCGVSVLVEQSPGSYRVAKDGLRGNSIGLAFRERKEICSRHTGREYAAWGSVVRGTDEGDGWLKVPWVPEEFGLLEQFELDQMWVWALRQGSEVYAALDEMRSTHGPSAVQPLLVGLADVSVSKQRGAADPTRDVLLARACAAAVILGHHVVLLVAGENHLDSVSRELLRLQEVELDSFGEREGGKTSNTSSNVAPVFLSKRGVDSIFDYRQTLQNLVSPEDLQKSLREFEDSLSKRETSIAGSELFGFQSISCLQQFESLAGLSNLAGFKEADQFLTTLTQRGEAIRSNSMQHLLEWWQDVVCEAEEKVPTALNQTRVYQYTQVNELPSQCEFSFN